MKPSKRHSTDLDVLVPWILERLLEGEFRLKVDADGRLRAARLDEDYAGMSLEHMEQDLRGALSQTDAEALFRLKESRSPETIMESMQVLFPGPIGMYAGRQLADSEWWAILTFVYDQSIALANSMGKIMVKETLQLSTPKAKSFDDAIRSGASNAHTRAVQKYYVAQIRNLFPGIVKRAEKLRVLSAANQVPEYVQHYLSEPSRCYIYGQFLAALFLCRSALEEAVEDRLRSKGHGAEIAKIERSKWLYALLSLARDKSVLNESTHRCANEIRELAKDAIHGNRLPEDEQCRKAYKKTRFVLESLYQ